MIGMDGLDPKLLKNYMAEGHLPHFSAVASSGSFSALHTSNPPQSPVAWSNLISGQNPGHHDVFDFVIRDPTTYLPQIGMIESKGFLSGLTGPNQKTRRKGKSYWDLLGDKGISNIILHSPMAYPAEKMEGRLLSGMGTPDLRGTQGVSFLFTTETLNAKDYRGKIIKVVWEENKIWTDLPGPKIRKFTGKTELTVPVTIEKRDSGRIQLTIQNQSHEMSTGTWSPWIRLKFKSGPFQSIYGIVKFHLNSRDNPFSLYGTAVNIDPQDPAVAISYPDDYSEKLVRDLGNFYTQGMPYDTWALNENRLTEEKFLEQAYSILDENIKLMNYELDRFESGLFFSYFGIPDLISHMFWRYIDPKHPNQGNNENPEIQNAISNVYKRMDALLGEVMGRIDDQTLLIVVSDHGFASYRRSVHLNSWLRQNKLFTLNRGDEEGKEIFGNVNWNKTKAYSVGFGGIYINQDGRERDGIVKEGQPKDRVINKIIQKLEKWKDKDGTPVVKKVYKSEEIYTGPHAKNGPDLFVGFNRGYRASWQTALGAAPRALIEDNKRMWGGDHLCDPSFVPGVVLSNKKLALKEPDLKDILPTLLAAFHIEANAPLKGKSLLAP